MLRTAPLGAAETMAIDEALLDRACREEDDRPALRIYRWRAPSLSIGVNQQLSEEVRARCLDRGVEVVRRMTGGGAVLHDNDLTYSVVAPRRGMGVFEAYRWVAQGLIEGLSALGLAARVAEHEAGVTHLVGPSPPGQLLRRSSPACFASTLGADLQVGEAKICGSAQVRRKGWFLQHGSIPISDVRQETYRLLRHEEANSSTCIEELRPGTSWEEVAECVILGFSRAWGAAPVLTPVETSLPSD